jgi:hypothetical protein
MQERRIPERTLKVLLIAPVVEVGGCQEMRYRTLHFLVTRALENGVPNRGLDKAGPRSRVQASVLVVLRYLTADICFGCAFPL